jgi:hypothetical protein
LKNSCLILFIFICLNLSAPRDQRSLDRPDFTERLEALRRVGRNLSWYERMRKYFIKEAQELNKKDKNTIVDLFIQKFSQDEDFSLFFKIDDGGNKVPVDSVGLKEMTEKLMIRYMTRANMCERCHDERYRVIS